MLFFLLLRLPPISTLFLYTTLYRSRLPAPERRPVRGDRDRARRRLGRGLVARTSDRKSTRLNSSHVSISYAVFCLKKKTHRHTAACTLLRHSVHHCFGADQQRCH